MIVWQVEFSIVQGSAGETWWTMGGIATSDRDECADIVWWEGFYVCGAEDTAAAVDAKGVTGRGGRAIVDAERTDCWNEDED